MGTPAKDQPGGPARCILGRDLAGNTDQGPFGPRLSDRQPPAARDASDDLLGAAASAPAREWQLPGGDAEIDAEAQSRMSRPEGVADQNIESELSGGHRHAERPDGRAAGRSVSGRVAASCQSAGALARVPRSE